MTPASLNAMPREELVELLRSCCHCGAWAERVADQRPFVSEVAVFAAAESAWDGASEAEVLEAMAGHPQIGDLEALRNKYAATASAEQGQVAAADDKVLERLRDLNAAYLERFGFIFIVCATGKRAEEMLRHLEDRIDNTRDEELANGATEQGKITRLRLEKLLTES